MIGSFALDVLIGLAGAVLLTWLALVVGLLLALPIDLVPDFIPFPGHADDAIVVVLVLRSVVRRAGIRAVRARWPGTEEGFATAVRLTAHPACSPPRSNHP